MHRVFHFISDRTVSNFAHPFTNFEKKWPTFSYISIFFHKKLHFLTIFAQDVQKVRSGRRSKKKRFSPISLCSSFFHFMSNKTFSKFCTSIYRFWRKWPTFSPNSKFFLKSQKLHTFNEFYRVCAKGKTLSPFKEK